ncbi:hypothetical protein DE146DRAFT_606773 [Phaeosphaeria sp. MPI-PUGE-AT-0046c]|nr:hypothetical protein DE146DRAFT_606773 [Phaeosphaeria sp. MPI-PUGE-AT-0046c]
MSADQSKSTNWFGELQLAYKFIVVFVGLLVLVFVAGLIKVFFDRRKYKIIKKEELEAGPREDTVELNQREKDEGDLFGIRAIEAGFYAGVAQSRPTSRAGSVVGTPTMSSSTLVGGSVNSLLMKGQSANTSVLSLNLGITDANSQRRPSPPNMKLCPSEAELTGKHGAVDMSLQLPPSPGVSRGPSPTFGGSDDGSSDGFRTPVTQQGYYVPASKSDALQAEYYDGQEHAQSQVASYISSPTQSPPPHPAPATRLPTLPSTIHRKESRSPSPETNYPSMRVYQPTTSEPAQPPSSSAPQMPAQTLFSTKHKRDASDGSSMYSQTRLSTFDTYQAYQKQRHRSLSTVSDDSYRLSIAEIEARPSAPVLAIAPATIQNSCLSIAPALDASRLSVAPNGQEQRLSDFYDAYYRNSSAGPVQALDAKRVVGRHSTIVEAETPLASSMSGQKMPHAEPAPAPPGAAF